MVGFGASLSVTRRISSMKKTSRSRKVALLAADGFEQVEPTRPRTALEKGDSRLRSTCTTLPAFNHQKLRGFVSGRKNGR
jgi:hypothetical protein